MSTEATFKTRCPVCQRKYQLPLSAAGHKARCTDCNTVFRVPVPPPAHASPSGTLPAMTSKSDSGVSSIEHLAQGKPHPAKATHSSPVTPASDTANPASAPTRSPAATPSRKSSSDSVEKRSGTVSAGGRQPHPPTEEDILRWLSENEETDDDTPQPRVVRQVVPVANTDPAKTGAPITDPATAASLRKTG